MGTKVVSPDPIYLTVYSKNVPNLTMVDMVREIIEVIWRPLFGDVVKERKLEARGDYWTAMLRVVNRSYRSQSFSFPSVVIATTIIKSFLSGPHEVLTPPPVMGSIHESICIWHRFWFSFFERSAHGQGCTWTRMHMD
jgi:hypothetical protein